MGIDITLAMCSVDPFGFLGMLVCGRARGPEYRPVATWGLQKSLQGLRRIPKTWCPHPWLYPGSSLPCGQVALLTAGM